MNHKATRPITLRDRFKSSSNPGIALGVGLGLTTGLAAIFIATGKVGWGVVLWQAEHGKFAGKFQPKSDP